MREPSGVGGCKSADPLELVLLFVGVDNCAITGVINILLLSSLISETMLLLRDELFELVLDPTTLAKSRASSVSIIRIWCMAA
jgi:hypothetical protein